MTNKVWMAACSAILGCATVAMAQNPPPAQSNPSSTDKKITITGCLAAAPANPTASATTGTTGTTGTAGTAGTTGTAGAAGATTASSPAFQLTNATVGPAESAANPPGATDPPPANAAAGAGAGQTYNLIANPTALSPHVGKKLALTGTLEEPNPAAASAAGAEAKMPTLRVETGKILAESCTQQ